MRRLLLILLAPALWAQTPAPIDAAAAAKRADIQKIFAIAKVGEVAVRAMEQSLPALKEASPQVPEVFWTAFMAEFTPKRMEDLVLPIYEEVLTMEEVKAYLAYLSTPAGASMVRKQPLILQRSMDAGQKLGAEVGRKVVERLQAEGKL